MTARRRRQQRDGVSPPLGPLRPAPPRPALTTEQTRQLGRELVTELAQDAGDPEAVRAVLLAWLEREDVSRLALASMAGLQLVFADCLTRVPVDQIPAGALTLTPPPERTP